MSIKMDMIVPEVQIARSALEPDLAVELAREIDQLWEESEVFNNTPFDYAVQVTGTESVGELWPLFGPALRQVVEICEVPQDANVSINSYGPLAASTFHTDWRPRAIVVHPTGKGAYDFSRHARDTSQAKRSHMTLDISAGDIVFASGKIWHRGRNKSQSTRRNVVFFP